MTQQKPCFTHCETLSNDCDSLRIYHKGPKSKLQSYTGMFKYVQYYNNVQYSNAKKNMTDVVVIWTEDGKAQRKKKRCREILSLTLFTVFGG